MIKLITRIKLILAVTTIHCDCISEKKQPTLFTHKDGFLHGSFRLTLWSSALLWRVDFNGPRTFWGPHQVNYK